MATRQQTAPQIPFDPAAEADRLFEIFNGLSNSLDEFLISANLPPAESAPVQAHSRKLEDMAHHFTAVSMAATLRAIQPQLDGIKTVTAEAKEQLNHLNDVAKVIAIAQAAVNVGTAIAGANPAAILGAAEGLAHTLAV